MVRVHVLTQQTVMQKCKESLFYANIMLIFYIVF